MVWRRHLPFSRRRENDMARCLRAIYANLLGRAHSHNFDPVDAGRCERSRGHCKLGVLADLHKCWIKSHAAALGAVKAGHSPFCCVTV